LTVFRPADASETAAVWRLAVERDRPCALALTRQKLAVLAASDRGAVAEGVSRGAYVLSEPSSPPSLVIVATGSEVHLALDAQARLEEESVSTRVVSMPSREVFFEQPPAYRVEVFPPGVPTLAIEAGVTLGWRDVVGDGGGVIGLDRFGESAPGPTVMNELGFNVENVLRVAKRLVGKRA
jgi:transketolase